MGASQSMQSEFTERHAMQAQCARRDPPPRSLNGSIREPVDVSARFGKRLRELRRSRNMSQVSMAVDFGIDRSFISDVERGRKSISLPTMEVIALGLKISLSDLLRGI
jgi:ribosome-binding protein aMBF1 (putative translation factor)